MANKKHIPKPGSKRVGIDTSNMYWTKSRWKLDHYAQYLCDGNEGQSHQLPMKRRAENALAFIRSRAYGLIDRQLSPDILKKLLADKLVYLKRSTNGGSKNKTYIHAFERPEKTLKRVAEPYKKRHEDLDASGLHYRGKNRGKTNE